MSGPPDRRRRGTGSPGSVGSTTRRNLPCRSAHSRGKDSPYAIAAVCAMITSKLTSKAQTTIPQPVRAALRLVEGDELAYEIDGGRVILTKVIEREPRTLSGPSLSGAAPPTGRPMQSFKQGDVVRVPFPYTDRATRQWRPALVVSRGGLGEDRRLLWVAMITSAENRPRPDDIPFGETYPEANLRRRQSSGPASWRPSKAATRKRSAA